MPGTTFSCYQFLPTAGNIQLHVCKEWARGRLFLDSLQSHPHISTSQLRPLNIRCVSSKIESHTTNTIGTRIIFKVTASYWSSLTLHGTDLCLDLDQFKVFKKISSPLICISSHKVCGMWYVYVYVYMYMCMF